MSRPTFYRLGLVTPFIPPALALVLSGVLARLPELLGAVLSFALVSALVWTIPYLPVVIGLLLWSRGKPAERIKRGFLLAPLLLAGAMAIFSLFLLADDGGLASAAGLAGLALLVGFAFVGLWLLLELLLARLGVF
jgi:hypothetical protein